MYVCENCVEDPCLQEVVRANLVHNECDYCGTVTDELTSCEISDVVDRIRFAIEQEYGSPDEETAWDDDINWYYGTVYEGAEIFDAVELPFSNERLNKAVREAFWDDLYCPIGHLAGAPHERQLDAWEGFRQIVQHRRRYTFLSMSEDECDHGIIEYPPCRMLQEIVDTLSAFPLITTLDPGHHIWRMRVHDEERAPLIPQGIASPTPAQAMFANRMSPAGVSMFYGADDIRTAWAETVDPERLAGQAVTVAAFETIASLNLLDLTAVPEIPSYFCDWNAPTRNSLYFLRAFRDDVARPIVKDGRHHVEYVPTQVFTEFVRFELRTLSGDPIMGIRYPSAKNGRSCCVIFAEQAECMPPAGFSTYQQLLQCVPQSARIVHSENEL